ncbi:thiamine phosphate synthase [Thermochromatium tepidum]|jgi:thiamine-phosphate diphosphorylase|uniref:Thiamine-phosphate synthase n=1 Tax=Thermochromatium tepidum ATCC 43061 TaxID=316276 RepID=A0A6I6EHZ9_THETI|nr:thiamine phosphate synthase [Thermochromatium tepidum]QGU33900.1 thiamine phosphate synthase [Thermochromatium tepidum ATCC 43061]
MTKTQLRGLYAITPDAPLPLATLVDQVGAAIAGGARLIQYRDKTHPPDERHRYATALLACCRAAGVPLIINDDLELAAVLGADGVHLGRDDPDPRLARKRLGESAIIGVSCYDQLALAEAAQAAGASYVAFGSFFPSPTKPNAVRPAPDLLTAARGRVALPLVAIGGITPHNGRSLITAGADMLAVVTGVFAQPDITAAACAYTNLFSEGDPLR